MMHGKGKRHNRVQNEGTTDEDIQTQAYYNHFDPNYIFTE